MRCNVRGPCHPASHSPFCHSAQARLRARSSFTPIIPHCGERCAECRRAAPAVPWCAVRGDAAIAVRRCSGADDTRRARGRWQATFQNEQAIQNPHRSEAGTRPPRVAGDLHMGHVSRRRGVPSPRCAAPRRKNFERAEIGLAKCSRLADAPHVRSCTRARRLSYFGLSPECLPAEKLEKKTSPSATFERGFSLPRYSAENGQASRRTSLREHAGNAQPTGSAKDRKRTASPSAALRFSFFLSCTFPRGSGSTFRGGFCFSHSFLAFFWLSLAAHFLLSGNSITAREKRLQLAA